MTLRVRVRARSYAAAAPIVGRDDGDSYLFGTGDIDPDVGISLEGRCGHCRQRYVVHECAPGGFPCDCCGTVGYGGIFCARCARWVDLAETDT